MPARSGGRRMPLLELVTCYGELEREAFTDEDSWFCFGGEVLDL